MKRFAIMLMLLAGGTLSGLAQELNWNALRDGDAENIIVVRGGYDFGMTARLGYRRAMTLPLGPAAVGCDVSVPMGNILLDDFKVRLGGEAVVIEADRFAATLMVYSLFRRYETALVRVAGFGAEIGGAFGYYAPAWSVAAELGFDKQITSHVKHAEFMRAMYPAIRDGWYIPNGGHWSYGLRAGKTLGDHFDLSLRLGATRVQMDDEEAAIPYYAQLGWGVRF